MRSAALQTWLSWLVGVALLFPAVGAAEETGAGAPPEPAAEAIPSDASPSDASPSEGQGETEIAGWIAALDSDRFAERERAQGHLAAAGPPAVDAVADATSGVSREVTMRTFSILRDWLRGEDGQLKQQVRAALERLAASDDARLARRAAASLAPPVDRLASATPRMLPGVPRIMPIMPGQPGRIQIRGGGIQIGGIPVQGGIKVVQVQNVNGNRKVKVREGDLHVEIDEPAGGPITMEVTDKVNGKQKKTRYQAKDADELRKQHPEAGKLYDKYSGGGLNVLKRGIAQPGQAKPQPPQAQPQPPRNVQRPGGNGAEQARQRRLAGLRASQKRLDEAIERLRNAPGGDTEGLRRAREQLEETRRRLDEAAKKLDR